MQPTENPAKHLLWLGPVAFCAYLAVAWHLSRWQEDELLVLSGAALASGIVGICMQPLPVGRRILFGALYLIAVGSLLLALAFYGLGCGVFGHCL